MTERTSYLIFCRGRDNRTPSIQQFSKGSKTTSGFNSLESGRHQLPPADTSPAMAKVMDQLSEITTVLQDVQSKYQALLQDTTSLKTSFSQLMERLDFEPTSNLFANFATSVIYELREVDHGTITPLLPPSNISPTPIWTKKGHLQPRWDHSARAKINKEWADNFRNHFVHPDSQLAKQMGLSPKHRASLSLKEIENFHLQAFSNLQAKSGHHSTTKRKSSGPAVLQQDTNEHDLTYSEGEPESENVDIDYTLELKHHKRHSKV